MTDPLPSRTQSDGHARPTANLRLRIAAATALLLLTVISLAYLIVPPAWTDFPRILAWMAPAAFVALAGAIGAGQYMVETVAGLQHDVVRWRELARVREEERDVAQDEIVRRLQQERDLAREKMQFEAQLSAYEKYAALAQLALGAAHEINNPLLGISSHLELELRHTTDTEQQEEIEQCIQGTRRISSTIRGLINYARPGPLILGKIQLGKLIEENLAFLRHQPMFRRIALEANIAVELPAITADANQLSQILMNLLINAAEAMASSGGTIAISAQKIKFADTVELAVSDTGCGISPDVLAHIFEPFFTTKRGKGTGLGLSISHAYVRSHGGDIRVESKEGEGTTVRITLPVRQPGAVTVEQEQEVVI